MSYTTVALKQKIMEMYPEIRDHRVGVDVTFHEGRNAYLLTFTRGTEVLSTHLEKKDADGCMNGIQCVYLGVQVAQFIRNFEARKSFDLNAA